jgi:RNA polymerase sigma-70 factor, ECF subfamily
VSQSNRAGSGGDAVERAWVDGIRSGDVVAFEAMVHAYASRLAGFVWTYLMAPDESEEVVQDLFLWIWQHRFEWDLTGPLRKYLFRAAANRALKVLRRRRVDQRFRDKAQPPGSSALKSASSADDLLAEQDLGRALERALATLPSRCRTVFIMQRQQHMSYAEIGELLGISARTVEVHMARALGLLRDRLADWTGG